MKILLIILSSFLLALDAQAEDILKTSGNTENASASVIRGKVIEEVSGESLIGVEIEIIGSGISTFTGMEGEFEFTGLEIQSEYTIRISYISYKNKIIRGLNPGNENVIIELQNQSIPEKTISSHSNPGA